MLRERACEFKRRTRGRVVEPFLSLELVRYGNNGDGQRVWESVELMICHLNCKHHREMLLLAIYQYISIPNFIFIPECALYKIGESARFNL